MFKVYNNVHREIIMNRFSKKSIIYTIRDINNFNIPSSKLNICSHCLISIDPYLWNSLCNSFKKMSHLKIFKKKLKLSLIKIISNFIFSDLNKISFMMMMMMMIILSLLALK